ncbi:hypothetical protein EJB05_56984, partial [Eragrostis curvula]
MGVRVVLLLTRLRSATRVARDRGGRSYGSGRRRLHGVALPIKLVINLQRPSSVSPSRVLGTAPPCSPGALGKGGDQRLVVHHQLDGRTRGRLACCAAHQQLEDPPVPPICSLSDNLIAVPYQGEVLGRFNVCKSLIAWRMLLLFHLHRPAPSINQGLLELWDVGHVVAGNFIGIDAH